MNLSESSSIRASVTCARSVMLLAIAGLLTACGGGGGGGSVQDNGDPADPGWQNAELDSRLLDFAKVQAELNGDPATPRAATQALPDSDPLIKLGQLLFFSETLSASYDASCAACHHPDLAGADALSLPVGVAARDPSILGPGREVDPALDLDPSADNGPNMHRNSLTTFNNALFDRALMFDGRVFVLEDELQFGGHEQLIQTPESGQRFDVDPVDGLLEFTMKGPIVNDNEMRGFLYTDLSSPYEYREHLVARLRGEVDTQHNSKPDAAQNWLALFRDAFGTPAALPAEIITMANVQKALAAYISSQVFIDNPMREYLEGNRASLTPLAKRGALLFLQPPEAGGLGCASCHSGDRFTDEQFHNLGFPQIGRGFLRSDNTDLGRWHTTRLDADKNAYRTPSLLNVALTAPYGHTGSFQTLEEVIRYHANPRREVDEFDFGLSHLRQFRATGIVYDHAESHTRDAIANGNFAVAEARLPRRSLTALEVAELVAFLESLTDRCAADLDCVSQWTPRNEEDPDGNMLIRDVSGGRRDVDAEGPDDYPDAISLDYPITSALETFADVQACSREKVLQVNSGELAFTQQTGPVFGLNDPHAYSADNWFNPTYFPTLEVTMIGGGVSAAYVDGDCWPDLIFSSGVGGMKFYRNVQGSYFESVQMLTGDPDLEYSGAAIADLNGDYRREILFGNIQTKEVPVYSQDGAGQYMKIAALPMSRPTYGISFASLDSTGLPYFYLAHWAGGLGSNGGTSPALWKSDGLALYPLDKPAATTSAYVDQQFNFTPKFADFTNDGLIDLVIASDFLTSTSLRNIGNLTDGPRFKNDTDREVITDQNGMGSALLDIDNDGTLEWFVTSVYETGGPPLGNWGQTGNRLYRNISTSDKIAFADITDAAGVRDGNWGWGACAADVNNDGFVDLFHVNGFGYIPEDVVGDGRLTRRQASYFENATGAFRDIRPRLFINDGDGSFTESGIEWQIAPRSEGRGLVCLDYDRDGDIDIGIFAHSLGLQFFENESGSGPGRAFIDVRLVGSQFNTDAIGAKVYVTAEIGGGHGRQTQLRLSEANSNFNSQNVPNLHFGLGQASVIEQLRVVWPDQTELTCNNVEANQFVILDQRMGESACQSAF